MSEIIINQNEKTTQTAKIIDSTKGKESICEERKDNKDLIGIEFETEDGCVYEMKEVVTAQFEGENITKVKPVMKAGENTVSFGEDFNRVNDWNDREFIIDMIEGNNDENVVGFWNLINYYMNGFVKESDLPDHESLKKWMAAYKESQIKAKLWNTKPDIDIEAGIRFYFDSCLNELKRRKEELKYSDLALNEIDQQVYNNNKMVIELAEAAIKNYLAGRIKL